MRIPLGALALMTGCTWVSPGDLDARLPEVDDDQDGYPKATDCNDNNAKISPGADETWYDGVDADCAKDDDFDADGDGYVPAEYEGSSTKGVPGSGGLAGGDCNDEQPTHYPGAEDVWYDGVDSDCGGEDDHDADGDGYVPVNHDGLPTLNVEGSGSLPEGDCDDTVAQVNPGAADPPYDGVDSDCQGEEDFDADADGFVPDEYLGMSTQYLTVSGGLPGGDCDDTNDKANPEATDVWYDGEDWDCEGDDDYDQDLDGHPTTAGGGDDCDDENDQRYPGNVEDLGDAIDQDCDGDAATFSISENTGLIWTAPHDLRFSSNSSQVYLSVAAEEALDDAISTTYYESVVAMAWDLSDLSTGLQDTIAWQRNVAIPSYTLTAGHDFLATDDALFGVTGLQLSTGRAIRIGGYDLDAGSRFGVNYTSDTYDDFTDLSLAEDQLGNLHAVGCEPTTGVLQYVVASKAQVATNSFASTGDASGALFENCDLHFYEDDPTGMVVAGLAAGGLGGRMFDRLTIPITFVPVPSNPAYDPADLSVPAGADQAWTVLADAANDAILVIDDLGETTVASVTGPTQVHAVSAGGDALVLGYVDDAGDAFMAWGDTTTGFDTWPLAAPFSASEVAVSLDATGKHVIVAVLGTDQLATGIARLPE